MKRTESWWPPSAATQLYKVHVRVRPLRRSSHQRIATSVWGGILSCVRNGPQEPFEMGYMANFIHPYRLSPPKFLWQLPQEMRRLAYRATLFMQESNYMRRLSKPLSRPPPRRVFDRLEASGYDLFQSMMIGFPRVTSPDQSPPSTTGPQRVLTRETRAGARVSRSSPRA